MSPLSAAGDSLRLAIAYNSFCAIDYIIVHTCSYIHFYKLQTNYISKTITNLHSCLSPASLLPEKVEHYPKYHQNGFLVDITLGVMLDMRYSCCIYIFCMTECAFNLALLIFHLCSGECLLLLPLLS